jgi:hypothetical protein
VLHFPQETEEAMKLLQTSHPENFRRTGSLEQKVRLLVRRHRAAMLRRRVSHSEEEAATEKPDHKPRRD